MIGCGGDGRDGGDRAEDSAGGASLQSCYQLRGDCYCRGSWWVLLMITYTVA